jgi:tetratricopeptide (TPR) repeat protein
MRKLVLKVAATAALLACGAALDADAQMAGGRGGMGGPGGRSGGGADVQSMQIERKEEKPEIQARKAYKTAAKALDKAKAYTAQSQQEKNADKQIVAQQKATEAYYKALDWFTAALSNDGDMAEAWSGAGYAHLHIGAYGEALDDYNHALKLTPADMDAVANRAEACLQLGRLDDVRLAYLDLFNHARERADQLMRSMQHWLGERRTDPQGLRLADLDAFQQWIDDHLKAAGA